MARHDLKTSAKARFTVQIGTRGRLVLPSEVRRRLNLEEGDFVVLSLEPEGSLNLVSLRERVRRGMGLFKDVAPGTDLASELIRERREEAKREARE